MIEGKKVGIGLRATPRTTQRGGKANRTAKVGPGALAEYVEGMAKRVSALTAQVKGRVG